MSLKPTHSTSKNTKMKRKRLKNEHFKVISVSGGRSSAMMLKIMLDNGQIDDDTIVCFANTGQEHHKTLDFVNECAIRWNIPVVWLEYRNQKPFFEIVSYETAARIFNTDGTIDSEPFKQLCEKRNYLPNSTQRFCTGDMKIKTIRRFVRSLGIRGEIPTYLGLRFDEKSRVAKKKASNAAGLESEYYYMPLNDMRITKRERDVFWECQPFQLDIPDRLGNCVGCFMKGEMNLIRIFRDNPEYANFYIWAEKNTHNKKRKRNGQFNKKWSYSDLLHVSKTQLQLDIDDVPYHGVSCSCSD